MKNSYIREKMMVFRGFLISSAFFILILFGCTNNDKGLEMGDKSFSAKDKKVIETYLNKKVMTDDYNITGNVYSAFDILGFNKEKGEIYIFALLQEYILSYGGVKVNSGWGCPFVLDYKKLGNSIQILNHSYPGDGDQYPEDIKKMFPKDLSDKIIRYNMVNNLNTRIEYKVKASEGLEIIESN